MAEINEKANLDPVLVTIGVWPLIAQGDMEGAMLKLHTKISKIPDKKAPA